VPATLADSGADFGHQTQQAGAARNDWLPRATFHLGPEPLRSSTEAGNTLQSRPAARFDPLRRLSRKVLN